MAVKMGSTNTGDALRLVYDLDLPALTFRAGGNEVLNMQMNNSSPWIIDQSGGANRFIRSTGNSLAIKCTAFVLRAARINNGEFGATTCRLACFGGTDKGGNRAMAIDYRGATPAGYFWVTAKGWFSGDSAVPMLFGSMLRLVGGQSGQALVGSTSSVNALYVFQVQSSGQGNPAMELRQRAISGSTWRSVWGFRDTSSANLKGAFQVRVNEVQFVSLSDHRLKTNVQDVTNARALVDALRPVRFRWNNSRDDDPVDQGFLAHEVAEVAPFAVFGEKDAVDRDGKIVPQNMDAVKLIPLLVAAAKEIDQGLQQARARLANI